LGVRLRPSPDPLCVKEAKLQGYWGLFMRSKDSVTASRDLFVSLGCSFINLRDLLVIFDPTNRININYRSPTPYK
jgi:hypothetical protein